MKKIIIICSFVFGLSPFFVSAAASTNPNAGMKAPLKPTSAIEKRDNKSAIGTMSSTTHATSSSEMRSQKIDAHANTLVGHADNEIRQRVNSLNQLAQRLHGMRNISTTTRTSLTTEIQTEISLLNALQTKIHAEASSTTSTASSTPLAQDIASITASYRIYALIIPQVTILADADKAITLANSLTTLATKLQTRIAAAQTAGKDITKLTAALTDLNAKLADAKVQAQAAITAVANLVPDNGNATIAASNKAALTAGRKAIAAATTDLRAAQMDARTNIEGLGKLEAKGADSKKGENGKTPKGTASSTASTTVAH
ncbi:MAG: hypothetical protein WCQ60_01890 [bacterium]